MFLHYFVKLVGSGICTLFTYVNGGMGNYSLKAGEMNWNISEQFDLFCSFLLYTPIDCLQKCTSVYVIDAVHPIRYEHSLHFAELRCD